MKRIIIYLGFTTIIIVLTIPLIFSATIGSTFPQAYESNGANQLAKVQADDDDDAEQVEDDNNYIDLRFNLTHDLIPSGKIINYFNVTCEHWENDGDMVIYYDYSVNNGTDFAGVTEVDVSEDVRVTVEYDLTSAVDSSEKVNNFVFRWKMEQGGGGGDIGYLDYCSIEYSYSSYGTLNATMSSPTDNQEITVNNTFTIK